MHDTLRDSDEASLLFGYQYSYFIEQIGSINNPIDVALPTALDQKINSIITDKLHEALIRQTEFISFAAGCYPDNEKSNFFSNRATLDIFLRQLLAEPKKLISQLKEQALLPSNFLSVWLLLDSIAMANKLRVEQCFLVQQHCQQPVIKGKWRWLQPYLQAYGNVPVGQMRVLMVFAFPKHAGLATEHALFAFDISKSYQQMKLEQVIPIHWPKHTFPIATQEKDRHNHSEKLMALIDASPKNLLYQWRKLSKSIFPTRNKLAKRIDQELQQYSIFMNQQYQSNPHPDIWIKEILQIYQLHFVINEYCSVPERMHRSANEVIPALTFWVHQRFSLITKHFFELCYVIGYGLHIEAHDQIKLWEQIANFSQYSDK